VASSRRPPREKKELEQKVVEKVDEKTSLDVDVHQLIDLYYDEVGDVLRAVYHCESKDRDFEAKDNIEQLKWVKPENIGNNLGQLEKEVLLGRENVEIFG